MASAHARAPSTNAPDCPVSTAPRSSSNEARETTAARPSGAPPVKPDTEALPSPRDALLRGFSPIGVEVPEMAGENVHTARPSPKDDLRLPPVLLALTLTTGLIDAASYLGLGHVFTANM